MIEADFALYNVEQLVTVAPGAHPAAEGDLGVLQRAALAARAGRIVWIGTMAEMQNQVLIAPNATVVNTHGGVVLPGFVDAHTHPVFAGHRLGDFYRRATGQPYREQMESGIMSTVRETRAKSEDALLDLAFARADTFFRYGTTTIEAKSGYGLDEESELRSLRVLNRLQHIHNLKVIPTFLGAHAVPPEYEGNTEAYVDAVISWLPKAVDHARFVDVWCDEGAFTPRQCRRVLEAARALGFLLRAHANELGHGGGVQLAAELGATSVDHCNFLDDADIAALKLSGTIPVLLPGTTLFLNSAHYAPARALLDAGIRVALGTDFNPGTSHTQNMQFILTLAVLKLGMTAEEAIRGATINAAAAVALDDRVGSLEPGKYCDFAVYRLDDYHEIPYFEAMNRVEQVVAGGEVVVRDGQLVPPHGVAAAAS